MKIFTGIFTLCVSISFSVSLLSQDNAPNFPLYSHDGKRFVFHELLKGLQSKGIMMVNFTSVTCKPCKKEIPELKGIAQASGGKVKLICIYAESGEPVRESASSLGVLDKAYVDPFGTIRTLFAVKEIPVTILFDRNAKVLGRFEKYTPENIGAIKALVK